MNLIFTVPGITCGHCAAAITQAVRCVPGVRDVDVDLAAKRVRVAGNDDAAAVRAAIADAGYQAD
jgi:copper chaperone